MESGTDGARHEAHAESQQQGDGSSRAAIRRVSGRGSGATRGLPPIWSMEVARPEDPDLTFGLVPHEDATRAQVRVFGAPDLGDFGVCPICGSAERLSREHVPQHDLGGTVMTYTCKRCNNGLGSRVETELTHWFDDAIFDVTVSGGAVPGRRKTPRILLRSTADGETGLIFDKGKVDPNIGAMLRSGTAQLEYRIPNPRVWRVAALKHAYLGACLALGEIPNTEHAAYVRGVLVTTRDNPRGELPPETALSKGLRLARSFQPAQGPTVLLVGLADTDGHPLDYGLSFAGTLFVSWPLDAHLFWTAARRLNTTPVLTT